MTKNQRSSLMKKPTLKPQQKRLRDYILLVIKFLQLNHKARQSYKFLKGEVDILAQYFGELNQAIVGEIDHVEFFRMKMSILIKRDPTAWYALIQKIRGSHFVFSPEEIKLIDSLYRGEFPSGEE